MVWYLLGYCDEDVLRRRKFFYTYDTQIAFYHSLQRDPDECRAALYDVLPALGWYSEGRVNRFLYDHDLARFKFTIRRDTRWRHVINKVRRTPVVYLFFVTEADPNPANKEYGEPVLASAGRDPEDSWKMLAANRQRMTGEPQDASKLKAEMTARGYHVAKYSAAPL